MNVVTREDRVLREARRAAERRRRLRFVGMGVAIPTAIALIYYAFIARPEYDVQMRFTVQGVSAPQASASDLLNGLGFGSGGGSTDYGKIITDYIRSQQMVRALKRDYKFDEAYRGPTLDPVGYIPKGATIEDSTAFWQSQVTTSNDTASNVIQIDVLAFSPDDALRLSQGVLHEAEVLVNSFNSKVQGAVVKVAQNNLDERSREYEAARQRVVATRSRDALTLDAQTQAQATLLSGLESQLAQARVDRAAQQATFQPGSPQMRAADEKIASLEAQRASIAGKLTGGPGQGEATRDVSAQAVLLDYETAQKNYYAAQQALQQAISTRENERKYLIPILPPTEPQTSNYSDRFTNVIAVALFAALLMGIGALSYSVVKDHLQ